MRRALIYSLALHVAVVLSALIGGFFWSEDLPPTETAVVVEVVPVADKTNVPVRKKQEQAKDTQPLERAAPKPKAPTPPAKPAATPPPPEPEEVAAVPAPVPAPKAPAPEVAGPEPDPVPTIPDPASSLQAAKPKSKPEQQNKPEPTSEPQTKSEPEPGPEPKNDPPSSFDSVLKTVEALRQSSPSEDEPKDSELDQPSEQGAGETDTRSRSSDYQASEPVTISEIDMVRRQIEKCWNLPAGARGAENMVVSIRVDMNIDGTPGGATVVEQERMRGDPFFRAAAESALRAVLNPRCHPFGLPREKFDSWKTMTLVFDPKEMFGT